MWKATALGEQALPVRSDDVGPLIRNILFLSLTRFCTASASGGGDIRNRVDILLVEPAANDRRSNVDLELEVGGYGFDRLAENVLAKIFDRHFGRECRPCPGIGGGRAVNVGHDANFDTSAALLGGRSRCGCEDPRDSQDARKRDGHAVSSCYF